MGRPSTIIILAEVVILSCAFRWSSPPNRIAQQFHGLRFRTVPCRGSARRRRRVDAPTEIANGLGRRRLCQEFGNRLAKFAIGYGRDRRAQRAVAGTSLRMRTSSAQKGNSNFLPCVAQALGIECCHWRQETKTPPASEDATGSSCFHLFSEVAALEINNADVAIGFHTRRPRLHSP